MLFISDELRGAIEGDIGLEVYGRAIIEWEMNSYVNATISFPDSVNEDLFPTKSVLLPRRPASGLPKMINGSSLVSSDETFPKFRVVTNDSPYKYYRSRVVSSDTGSIEFSGDVIYESEIRSNKIVIGFEESHGRPSGVSISIRHGEEWDSLGSYETNTEGQIVLFYNEGTWSEYESSSIEFDIISGIRVSVSSISRVAGSDFNAVEIIQVSPRLAIDISDRIVEYDINKVRDETNIVSPIGYSTASTGRVSFENTDLFFDSESPESIFYNIADKNVKVELSETFVTNSGHREDVRHITFFSESWNIGSDFVVTVEGRDRSKILQETYISDFLYKDKNIVYIIKDILETYGIKKYEVRYTDEDESTTIPFLFFLDEKSVWDSLQEIAMAEQSVFYFDENDTFVWESRDYLWSDPSVDYEFISREKDGRRANIISYEGSHNISVNAAKVEWSNISYLDCDSPKSNKVLWDLSEDAVLVSSALTSDILIDSTSFTVGLSDWLFFEQEGVVLVDSEYIEYKKSEDQGVMEIVNRGLFNSTPSVHLVRPDTNIWSFYTITKTLKKEGNGFLGRHAIKDGKLYMTLPQDNVFNVSHFVGGASDDSYSIYGCRMRFTPTLSIEGTPIYDGDGLGGMFIHSDGDRSGYYFELITTEYASRGGVSVPEARIWKFGPNDEPVLLAGFFPDNLRDLTDEQIEEVSGVPINVFPALDYDIDIFYRPQRSYTVDSDGGPIVVEEDAEMRFSVNGRDILVLNDNQFSSGKWGLFARGRTRVDFDYVYAVDRSGVDQDLTTSEQAIRNRIKGGFMSSVLQSLLESYNQLRSEVIIEDFGPDVKEVKEFDVRHELYPSITSDLFISNENSVFKVYHDRTSFGSRFALANKGRGFTILSGSDAETGSGMRIFAFGRPVIRESSSEYSVEDELSIIRRGRDEMLISSPWIQTEDHAKKIGDWIVKRWSRPSDEMSMEVFINPSIQLGDRISIDVPDTGFYPETHQYFVTSIERSQSNMSMSIRRIYD